MTPLNDEKARQEQLLVIIWDIFHQDEWSYDKWKASTGAEQISKWLSGALREARLEEAKWWQRRSDCYGEIFRERIAALEQAASQQVSGAREEMNERP